MGKMENIGQEPDRLTELGDNIMLVVRMYVENYGLTGQETLMVVSQLVGQLVAVQDPDKTVTEVMAFVNGHIKIGNDTLVRAIEEHQRQQALDAQMREEMDRDGDHDKGAQ